MIQFRFHIHSHVMSGQHGYENRIEELGYGLEMQTSWCLLMLVLVVQDVYVICPCLDFREGQGLNANYYSGNNIIIMMRYR